MSLPNLTLIAESINDSVPSTHALYEANNLDGIAALAAAQAAAGAAYIDVNVGTASADRMAEVVKRVAAATSLPLSIDSPDPVLARAGLEALPAGAPKPILNSISPLRREMFGLAKIRPFRPILLISEGIKNGEGAPCETVDETLAAARLLLEEAHKAGIANEDCIFDPGIAPVGSDTAGNLQRLMAALAAMHVDTAFKGVHCSVGLSNFTVMIPSRRASGGLVKGPLESAFLTRAMPLGIDTVIGSVKRYYELLKEGDSALACFDDCLAADGFDAIMRVQEFYES